MNDTHATTTTTARRLDNDRIADLAGDLTTSLGVFRQCPSEPGTQGTPAAFIASLRTLYRPSDELFRTRPDEHEAGSLDALGKIGVLGQETKPGWMVWVGHFSSRNDGRHI